MEKQHQFTLLLTFTNDSPDGNSARAKAMALVAEGKGEIMKPAPGANPEEEGDGSCLTDP